ncbi:MAG: hypothetical protein IKP98_03400 [Bacilli bacterium]|nr:hypothetical protein [Bacilli bacterium]
MKNIKKNKYIPFKKTIIPVLSILMIIVAILLFIYTIDNKKFNKGHKNYDKEYVMHITYLIMDKDEVPENITMEQTFNHEAGEFPEGILGTMDSIISLDKKGDFLYVDLDTYTHPSLLKNDTDYVFTKYNLNGEVIDGCEYDFKTNVIKVPVSYFEENKIIPIQAEIQTIMSKDEFENLELTSNVKKLVTKKVKSTNNAINNETEVNVGAFGIGRLSKKNLHIYINNADEEIPESMYEIYGKKVRISYPSILISKLDIKVDFSIMSAKAHTTSDPNSFNAIKVTGPINKHVGDTGTFSLSGPYPGFEIKYCGVWANDVCIRRNGELLWDPDEANWSYTYVHTGGGSYSSYNPNGNYNVLMNFSVSLGSLVPELQSGITYEPLENGSSYRVVFYCYDHNYNAADASSMRFRYTVISETSHSVTIRFESTNYYRSQDANAYLRFEWDNVEVGLRAKKVDDSGNTIQGLSITAVNMSNASDTKTATTDANGIATFANLTDGAKYKFYEDCNSTITVNGHANTTLAAQGISCVYPSSNPLNNGGSGYTPTEDYATATPVTMENIKVRHCVTVHKTKGTNNRNESGVQFQLTVPAGVCSLYNSTYTSSPVTTNSNGIVTFTHLGYCNGNATIRVADATHAASVIGDNPRTVSFVRSQIKSKVNGFTYRGVTYNAGSEIPAMTNSDFVSNEAAGRVEEVCPTTNQVEVRDKDYTIMWTKKDMSINGGQALSNITFNVTLGSTPVRVLTTKENYTDTNNVTRLCYKYTTSTGSNTTTDLKSDGNGEVCVFNLPKAGDNYTVTEKTTNVYSHSPITVTSSENYTNKNYNNYEYIIDFNKKELNGTNTSNSNGNLAGAKFTVKDSRGNTVRTKVAKETRYDNRNPQISRSCYVVDLVNTSNNTNSEFISDSDGYVCIVGVNKSENYTITEIDPATYYGYANSRSITEESKLTFNTTNLNPKMIYQCPTEVKITKTTTELSNASNDYKKIIYAELQKLTFNILDSNGNVLTFKWNSTTKHYEYQKAINDLKGTNDAGDAAIRLLNGVDVNNTSLVNMNLDILVNYLPEGTYTLREVSSINCGATSSSPANGSNCTCDNNTPNNSGSTTEETACSNMGYAHVPDITFTVRDTNTGASVTCNKSTDDSVKVSLTNKPTEVKFTKKDMYGYLNDEDKVKFENNEEVEAFDNITFKVRKQSTTNLSGTTSVAANNYEWFYITRTGEYRLDVLHKCSSEGQTVGGYTCTQNLHTNNGNLKLTHLCKCESYYIEEYEVPNGTVFVLPKLEGNTCADGYMKVDKNGKLECHPVKAIKVCDCDDSNPESSPPVIIEDLPTKQVFVKKDLKYNTIITDQNTTFELFLAKEGKICNPYDATSKANDCIQVYFKDRLVLNDEADGSLSYRLIPETSSNNKIKELHVDPNTGKLILRYLPSYIDREYVLMETKAPKGYDLPTGEKSVTRFKVVNDTVNVEVSNVPNKPSKAIIGKYDSATGELIPGFKFKVYKVNNYDENLTPMMQSKSNALEFKTIRDGSYEYREVFDTDLVTTCVDREGMPCSSIGGTLVDDTYEDSSIASSEGLITIKEGQALIQYLDTDTYYIIEEVEAPKGYKLPERESDRYTLFYVPASEEVSVETKVYNTESYFTFFKYDEYNNTIDGAKFKLQKLNNEKIYEDVALEDVSTETTKMYKILSTSENYEITTINGQATIYRLTEGQYRIIETSAPEGYELPKKTYNVVTFLVDAKGHTFGSNVIANKKTTTKTMLLPTASAELVINIQTGKKVIKYGLIITGILGLIGLMIFVRKKISK